MQQLVLRDGRRIQIDDTGADDAGADETDADDTGADDTARTGRHGPTLVWHHETPHTGRILAPIRDAAAARGLRVIALTRPGFGGADPQPGRDVASGAADLTEVLDALGIDHVVTMGGSGGGPHALAAAALLPDRVHAAAVFASPAPFQDTPTWWDGMADDGGLRSARVGREARIAWAGTARFVPDQFVDVDWAALEGDWAALGRDATAAGGTGLQGAADDDVAFVTDWGFSLTDVRCPVLVAQGGRDRVVPPSHGRLLAAGLPEATLDDRPGDGHVSVLTGVPQAMDWLVAAARE